MRRLILMRHAHTESNNIRGDKARNLTPRGVQQAQEAGVELRALGVDYALVSTAERTRQTFAALGLDVPVEFQDVLYHDGTETMIQRISEMTDDVQTLLVVGHAPTIPSLVAEMAFASNRSEADEAQCHFPTSSYSSFSFDGTWDQLADGDFSHLRLDGITRR
ncbi:MAG: histidine phosphatase family protein [Propionibacteriaceae bacterium]|nr:histidine phosphatase family protein [Propionibacteriaceae bacterium]